MGVLSNSTRYPNKCNTDCIFFDVQRLNVNSLHIQELATLVWLKPQLILGWQGGGGINVYAW